MRGAITAIYKIRAIRGRDLGSTQSLAEDCLLEYNAPKAARGPHLLDFGWDLCGDSHFSTELEWLVTNGLGGYASGTMARVCELWKGDGWETCEALRQAQLWIRDTINGEKAEYFQGFPPEFSGERMPIHVADTLYKASILARPDENDFEHPFHWEAFTYIGA